MPGHYGNKKKKIAMTTGPVTMKKTRNGMKKGKPNVTRSVSDALKKLKNRKKK